MQVYPAGMVGVLRESLEMCAYVSLNPPGGYDEAAGVQGSQFLLHADEHAGADLER